jgi:hypothetical protein
MEKATPICQRNRMHSKNDEQISGEKLIDALNRGAVAAYNDQVQRAVLNEAIRKGSYVAKPRPPGSSNAVYGTPIKDGFDGAEKLD